MGCPPLESSTSNFPGRRFSLRPSPRVTPFAVLEGELAPQRIEEGKGELPEFRGWRKVQSFLKDSPLHHKNCAITLPLALLPLKLGKHPQLPSGQPRYGVAGTASWIGD